MLFEHAALDGHTIVRFMTDVYLAAARRSPSPMLHVARALQHTTHCATRNVARREEPNFLGGRAPALLTDVSARPLPTAARLEWTSTPLMQCAGPLPSAH